MPFGTAVHQIGNPRTNIAGSSLAAQTWTVTFPTDVELVSMSMDLFTADTYTFSVDGVNQATQTISASTDGVLFTPASPITLTAGTHTFKVIGTAARRFYYNAGTAEVTLDGEPWGAFGEYASWFPTWNAWSEASSLTVAATFNVHLPTTIPNPSKSVWTPLPTNSSGSTTWDQQTWTVTFGSAVTLTRLLAKLKNTDTYTLYADGVSIATATLSVANSVAEFVPSSGVALTSGAHTFKVVGTAARNFWYDSTVPTFAGPQASVITGWSEFAELTGNYVKAFLEVAPPPGASGSASLSLSASGGASGAGAGSASLSLSATGGTSAAAAGSASLSLSATGSFTPPSPASGSAALSLSASGGAAGDSAGSASLNLVATGTALAVMAASGTATLTLSASGSAVMSAGGTAVLTLSTGGVAYALYETDTTNALDGLDLLLTATVTFPVPVATPPASVAAMHYDKALAYPTPTMVGGRPT